METAPAQLEELLEHVDHFLLDDAPACTQELDREVNEKSSAYILPEKLKDPGSITIPCQFGDSRLSRALADSGASINLMPYSFYKRLELPEPRAIRMAIHLANKSVTFPQIGRAHV